MRDIVPIIELLENEQLTVREASNLIEAVVERGEHPTLPAGEGRLRVCDECRQRMQVHDAFNRCPGDLLFGKSPFSLNIKEAV